MSENGRWPSPSKAQSPVSTHTKSTATVFCFKAKPTDRGAVHSPSDTPQSSLQQGERGIVADCVGCCRSGRTVSSHAAPACTSLRIYSRYLINRLYRSCGARSTQVLWFALFRKSHFNERISSSDIRFCGGLESSLLLKPSHELRKC